MFHQRVPARAFRKYEVDLSALAGADENRSPALEDLDDKKVDMEHVEVSSGYPRPAVKAQSAVVPTL